MLPSFFNSSKSRVQGNKNDYSQGERHSSSAAKLPDNKMIDLNSNDSGSSEVVSNAAVTDLISIKTPAPIDGGEALMVRLSPQMRKNDISTSSDRLPTIQNQPFDRPADLSENDISETHNSNITKNRSVSVISPATPYTAGIVGLANVGTQHTNPTDDVGAASDLSLDSHEENQYVAAMVDLSEARPKSDDVPSSSSPLERQHTEIDLETIPHLRRMGSTGKPFKTGNPTTQKPASKKLPNVISADDSSMYHNTGGSPEVRGRFTKHHQEGISKLANRAASVPPRCVDHYSFMANWPPQDPPRCDLGRRIDVFPPKDAPLHVQLQAYALRWAVWSAEIKDEDRRRQVVEVVADKMRDAWEHAVGENYYMRPMAEDSDQRNDNEEKVRKGRKRGISPGRQAAGFACEGKDPYAVTNAELAENNLTMDMIQKRVQEKDFDAGEQILDEVLHALDRNHLVVKDWTSGHNPSVRGRNLLMYSLFVVLDCRHERRKLNNLMKNFTKELQKRNTRARIETYQDREFQHLALASELHLATQEDHADSNCDKHEEDTIDGVSEIVDLAGDDKSEGDMNEFGYIRQSIPEQKVNSFDNELIVELAQEVLSAKSESDIYSVFAARGMNATAFDKESSFNVQDDQKLREVGKLLGDVFKLATHLVGHREMTKRQQNPSERLKMNHDARLLYEKISRARSRLAQVLEPELKDTLGSDTKVHVVDVTSDGNESESRTLSQDPRDAATNADTHETNQPTAELPTRDPPSDYDRVAFQSNAGTQDSISPLSPTVAWLAGNPKNHSSLLIDETAGENEYASTSQPTPVQTATVSQSVQNVYQGPSATPGPVSPTLSNELVEKRAYIDEIWRPWIDMELQKRGHPPIQGVISDWTQLRDILGNLGFTTSDRNLLLARFRTQFEEWNRNRGIGQQQNATASSPAISHTSVSSSNPAAPISGAPPHWPSVAEVQAFIPPHGIHANRLLAKFKPRIGQYMSQFSQLVQQAAFVDPTYMVYPSRQHAAATMSQNVPPKSPAPNKDNVYDTTPAHQSSRISFKPSQPSLRQPQQVLKLKLPQARSGGLPPPQEESEFPPDFKSTVINSTRGFSFRHLPHSTLEQRRAIDDVVDDYIDKTTKTRKKTYYGQYVFFKDPQDMDGPPIVHGFWDHKDGSRPGGSEWFFDEQDVPDDWLPKLGINSGNINEPNNTTDIGKGTQQSYREVWDNEQGRRIKLKLAGPNQSQTHGYDQARVSERQTYNTYPPGYETSSQSASGYQNMANNGQLSNIMRQQGQASTRARSYLDGSSDNTQTQTASQSTKRGIKRGSSATGNGGARSAKAGKRRKKNVLGDDEDDEDYVPGGD